MSATFRSLSRKRFTPNDYFDLVRDVAGELVEQVELIDEYENEEKFGADKKSYAYRVTYRSNDRTLTGEEVDILHKTLEKKTAEEFRRRHKIATSEVASDFRCR